MEDNREEEEKEFSLVDTQEWSLEVEERKCGAEEGQLREKDENEEEEKEKMVEEEDYHSYPLFRIGDKVFADPTCEGGLFLQSAIDQHGEEGGVEKKQAELDLPLLQPALNQAQQQEAEEKKTAAAMQYLAELELPFPAAQKKRIQQKEEEDQGKKVDKSELLSLLLPKEEEAIESECRECWLHLHSAHEHQAIQQQRVRRKKKLGANQDTWLKGKEEEIEQFRAELLKPALDIHNGQQRLEEEGEKEKLDAEPELPLLEGEEEAIAALTWEDLDILLHEVHHLL